MNQCPVKNLVTTIVAIIMYIDNPHVYDYQEEANFMYNIDGGPNSSWSHPR